MNDNDDTTKPILFTIEGSRPRYLIKESDEAAGFEEDFEIKLKVQADWNVAGVPGFGVIEIGGSRTLESPNLLRMEAESDPGLGTAFATKEGVYIRTILPFDVAWRISQAIGAGQIGSGSLRIDPIKAMGKAAYLRGLELRPR
jgi:hypothetical protein